MKVLVTGGAGYVGSVLVPLLLADGHEVTVVDSLLFHQIGHIAHAGNRNFRFVLGDIRDERTMQPLVAGADAIIHLAAIVGEPACRTSPDVATSTNVGASELINSLRSKEQTLLFSSTGTTYGTVVGTCTEETPLNPLSHYSETKVAGEKLFREKGGCIIFRFATGFGISPRLRLDVLPNDFSYRAVHEKALVVYEKDAKRTFIHVRDMARAFVHALRNRDAMVGNVYNVGDGSLNLTKEAIVTKIKDRTNVYVHYAAIGKDPEKRDYEVSYERINAAGFKTSVSMDEGLDELVAAFSMMRPSQPFGSIA